MQRARRPLPDHHQRHEGRTPGARLRWGRPRTDLAAVLRLRPGPAARPLPALWPPATCGSALARCHLLTRGAAPGSVGSPGGLLLWRCLMAPALSTLIVPGGGTISFPWGRGAPAPSFPLSSAGVSATRGDWVPGRTPDSPEYGVGAPGAVVGRGMGALPGRGNWPPSPAESLGERPLPPWVSDPPWGGGGPEQIRH